jgi:N-acetyltransferase
MNWLEPVTLEGKFIRLEPLNPELHAPSMFEGFDSQSTDFLSRGESIQTLEDLQRHLEGINKLANRINWAIRVLEPSGISGQIAGRISFSEVKQTDGWLEVGTMLTSPFFGGPCNPEGKLLLMTRAFEHLGAVRVQFKVDSRNERSQAAMIKLGATREGVLRKYQRRPDGFLRDSVIFSVLADEWPEVKRKLEIRLEKFA